MEELFNYFREFNIASVTLRLALAMFCGGIIGLERGRKHRAAGFRTYMVVSLGATLTMLLGQYEHYMITHNWSQIAAEIGTKIDVTRFGAQVINGIGFLGAGTILVTDHHQIKGLTTAAGLWTSACLGLAIGAGFYECIILALLLMFFAIKILPVAEEYIVENSQYMNIYIEFRSLDNVGAIIGCIKAQNAQILDIEIERQEESRSKSPGGAFALRINRKTVHTQILTAISELDVVHSIKEI